MEFETYLDSLSQLVAPLKLNGLEKVVVDRVIVVTCVDDPNQSARCRVCQAISPRRGQLPERRIRHTDFDGNRVVLEFRFPRVECSVHGVVMAHQSFFVPHSGFSIAFEDHALALVSDRLTASAVARELRINRNALDRILDHAYQRRRRS